MLRSHKDLLDLISTNPVPGLERLLSNGKKAGWGVSKIKDKAGLAIEGKYHVRNYTTADIDLATLICDLGGGGALHALNHSPKQLPSQHTIADARRQHRLRITVGEVKISGMLKNIETLFKDDIEVGEFDRVGHTLSQDEIASKARLCYLEETDEIGGLCEHANTELNTFKMGSDLTSIRATAKAVREGRVHIWKEFSVAAFSRHAETVCGAKPVLLLPTCKQGSWQSSAQLQKLVQAWKISPFGEVKHGPLWSIASDGDETRRAALYLICMHQHLEKDDSHYELLSELEGLNLHCREDGLTMDFDYKHLFKRKSSLDWVKHELNCF
ncbi:hypothetical protein B0H14DRAFT_3747783 [Mycena olivaceomarginata]|nr:hypothetical protein B0H14DRAFT_3747783 [Mycena olivaceomarginata]